MPSTISDDVVDAIIIETVDYSPEALLAFYRDPPGRRVSEQMKLIAETGTTLGDEDLKAIIRDVADATVFTILGLLDTRFRNLNISVDFRRDDGVFSPDMLSDGSSLLQRYRTKINPGGLYASGAAD